MHDRLGMTGYSTYGEEMTIIRYGGAEDIDVRFSDGTVVQKKQFHAFLMGMIKNPNRLKNEREGKIFCDREGLEVKVIEYRNADSVLVEYLDDGVRLEVKGWSFVEKKMFSHPFAVAKAAIKKANERWPNQYVFDKINEKKSSRDFLDFTCIKHNRRNSVCITKIYDKNTFALCPTCNAELIEQKKMFDDTQKGLRRLEKYRKDFPMLDFPDSVCGDKGSSIEVTCRLHNCKCNFHKSSRNYDCQLCKEDRKKLRLESKGRELLQQALLLKKRVLTPYEYVDVTDFYSGCGEDIRFICSLHGFQEQKRSNHIHSLEKGYSGCKECKILKASDHLSNYVYSNRKSISECQNELDINCGGHLYEIREESTKDGIHGFTIYCLTHKEENWVSRSDATKIKYGGCQKCKESNRSSGERLVINACRDLDIKIDSELPLNILKYNANRLRLDVFLIDYSIGIEIQGSQHFPKEDLADYSEIEDILRSGNLEEYHSKYDAYIHTNTPTLYGHFLDIHFRDEIKRVFCSENGIILIYYIDRSIAQKFPVIIGRLVNKGYCVVTNEEELKRLLQKIKNNELLVNVDAQRLGNDYLALVEKYTDYRQRLSGKCRKYQDPFNIEFVCANADKMSDSQMAKSLGVSSNIVKRIRDNNNIPLFHKGAFSEVQKKYIDDNLGNVSQKKIAETLGVPVHKIERYVKNNRKTPYVSPYKDRKNRDLIHKELMSGKSIKDISAELGYSKGLIRTVKKESDAEIHRNWLPEEIKILKDNWLFSDDKVMCELLPNHSYHSIAGMANNLGFKKRKKDIYTEEDDQIIRQYYCDSNFPLDNLLELLGNRYSLASVQKRAQKLNVKRKRKRKT